jgi:hypothetical protein
LETHPREGPADIGRFAGIFGPISGTERLLAMQKVVGSNPISRFVKGLHMQVFFVSAAGFEREVAT